MANYKKKSGVMLADKMRKAVLQSAIMGKLTEQRADDGNASDLLEQIRAEKARLMAEKVIKREKPLPPVTDEDKPFDIPDSWVWVRLGDIIEVKGGKRIPAGKKLTTTPTKHIYIRVADMQKGTVIDTDLHYVDEETVKTIKNYTISSDDIYITCAGTIGRVGLIPEKFNGANLTENADKLVFTHLNKNYLYLLLESDFIQRQIINITTKVGQPKLAIQRIKNLVLIIPPLAEQQRIVAKLEQIFPELDRLQADEQQIHALQSAFPAKMQASLLQSAISGKLTTQNPETDGNASDLLTQIQAEKQRLIAEKVIKKEKPLPPISDDEKPFDIPDNWLWVRLGEIIFYNMGKTPPRNNANYWGNDYHWISIADMIENGTILTTKEKVSQPAFEDIFKQRIAKAGTMIMSFKLTIGRVSILGMDAFHNEAIISIYPLISSNKVDVLKSYLFKILPYVSTWGDSKKAIKGNTLNSDSISNMLIPLPPLAEQKRIVEKLDQLLPQVQSLT